MSLSQYEREVNLGRSDFGSLAYQIEMCRIQADITTICDGGEAEDIDTNIINQADSKICDFLRRVPRWKMDVGKQFALPYYQINARACGGWFILAALGFIMYFFRDDHR